MKLLICLLFCVQGPVVVVPVVEPVNPQAAALQPRVIQAPTRKILVAEREWTNLDGAKLLAPVTRIARWDVTFLVGGREALYPVEKLCWSDKTLLYELWLEETRAAERKLIAAAIEYRSTDKYSSKMAYKDYQRGVRRQLYIGYQPWRASVSRVVTPVYVPVFVFMPTSFSRPGLSSSIVKLRSEY